MTAIGTRLGAILGWGAAALMAILLASVAFVPEANWTVRSGLAAFCILAIARPDAALLVTTALLGFGIILAHLAGLPPLRVTEVLVVGSLMGCLVRAMLPAGRSLRLALARSISTPAVLLAIAVLAAAVVWERVYQFQSGYPEDYWQALRQFVTLGYFVQPGSFLSLISALVILEGLALFLIVTAFCRADATFFDRALRMMAIGGAGLAVMSVVRLVEILLRNPGAIAQLRSTAEGLRISPQIPDYIAAGSYFGLCWLAALGIAMDSSRRRPIWLAAAVASMAALYLTGSRSVIVAALAGLAVMLLLVFRRAAAAARRVAVVAVVAVTVMVLSYSWLTGRDVAGEMAWASLTIRQELLMAGLRVMETRPVFGIGIDRFYLVAGTHASPELRALWSGRMNPHNDFLRFGAELGVVGLVLFLGILAVAGWRTWRAVKDTGDPRLAGVAGGLAAFLVTSLVSNPLMVRDVSYSFWIALGLAAGYAARLRDERATAGRGDVVRPQLSRARAVGAALLALLLIGSIPFRARQEIAAIDPARVSYGFFEWGTDRTGVRCRWTGPRATLFVKADARLVEIPLSGGTPAGAMQQVDVVVDGKLADRAAVGAEWQYLRTVLPATDSTGPRRIDLQISPTWVPAEAMPDNSDRRELGVKVGELRVDR